jgi:chemotaxis protein histidine kinase CheA
VGLVSRVMRALTKAQSEVTRLEALIERCRNDAETHREELARLQASAGDAVLAAMDDPQAARAAARERAVASQELQFLVTGHLAAAEAAELQLRDAREELALAQAAEKRQQAAKLTAEADAHQGKVDALLDQLEELDGPRYVPERPSPDDHAYALQMGRSVSWILSKTDLLREPIGPLLAEAEALEAPVLEARRAREAASRPLVPSASIMVPAWDDIDSDSQLVCQVSEGAGSATFEVRAGGQQGGTWTVTLPDETGRRSWGRRVKLQAGGGGAEIRCNGEVLAKETRPGRLMNDGFARWWVER